MPETEPYTLEKLEKLHLHSIKVCGHNQLVRFFSQTLFPCLTHLHIHIEELYNDPEDSMPQLDPIPLFPLLRFLSVMDDDGLPLHLTLQFLDKMLRLQILNMEISGYDDNGEEGHHTDLNKLCKVLAISAGCCHYLPLLEECSFLWGLHCPYVLDVTLIARFIQSRTQKVPSDFSTLKRVTFDGNFGFMSDLREEVGRISFEEPSLIINIDPKPDLYASTRLNPLGLRRDLENTFR